VCTSSSRLHRPFPSTWLQKGPTQQSFRPRLRGICRSHGTKVDSAQKARWPSVVRWWKMSCGWAPWASTRGSETVSQQFQIHNRVGRNQCLTAGTRYQTHNPRISIVSLSSLFLILFSPIPTDSLVLSCWIRHEQFPEYADSAWIRLPSRYCKFPQAEEPVVDTLKHYGPSLNPDKLYNILFGLVVTLWAQQHLDHMNKSISNQMDNVVHWHFVSFNQWATILVFKILRNLLFMLKYVVTHFWEK
jgi:hypothetical protein